ncbi:MAG TPA: hypothetical protein GX714_06250 [Chloroflexi bacterium]|nr:hypothetical protein [Chloroflexota bacterium]
MSRADMATRKGLLSALQGTLETIDTAWWWLEGALRAIGILPRQQAAVEPLESIVQETLRRVEPSDAFRQSLRSELAFAAHQRNAGLIVEHPRPFCQGLIVGVSLGLAAILGTTLLVIFWPRRRVVVDHA